MLDLEEWMEVKEMKRQGHSIREISRKTGYSRNTVRKVLREGVPKTKKRKRRGSKLDEYKGYLKDRFELTGLNAVRLLEEIQKMGFTGSVDIVRRYLQEIEAGQVSAKATVRFETPPGEQAQVDWAEVGSYLDGMGKRRKVYAFVMVLSYSRDLYIEFTLRMRLEQLIACHLNAFEHFGGWTHSILFDNMAQVRLPSGRLNPQMEDFLLHHGIRLKTHRAYRPRTKGKVERTIRYLKDNFMKGRAFADLADLQAQGQHWQNETANRRIHATTKRRPVDLLKDEKLTPISSAPRYQMSEWFERTVSSEGFVRIGGNRYSVPPAAVGRKVFVEQGQQRIVVRHGEVIIAEHPRARTTGESIVNRVHVSEMWKLTMSRMQAPPRSTENLLFQVVQTTPLAVYKEAVG